MQRFALLTLAGMIGGGVAIAGSIQIGGASGLTGSYIASGCSTNVGGQTCVTGTVGSFIEANYDNRLFQTATEGGAAPTPYSTYSSSTANAGTLAGSGTFDTGTTFSMIDDGCGGTSAGACTGGALSNNFWDGEGTTAMLIPIGIKGVTDVWTVLDNIWGTPGANDTSLTFTFGSTANATAGTTAITVNLTNSSTGNPASGQVRTSINCSTVGGSFCNNFAIGTLATTTTNIGGTGVNVNTDNLVDPAYNGGVIGRFTGSQGNLSIDDQQFVFSNPALSSLYLVSIGVQEQSGRGQVSQSALSAITVDTSAAASATPEPSTVFLVLAGLGVIGTTRRRFLRS